tara:strand:- start:274 stop:984 length:711 start_codon:yes stop_codon:yes gene_type:complete
MKNIKLAVIPARGGSTRIHKKNIKDFHGKPIIAYTIETLLASNLFDKVIVSTDSDEIKHIAESFGAEVPFMRDKNLSDSFTPTVPVIKDAIEKYEAISNQAVTDVCCMYAIAPFISVNDIKNAYSLYCKNSPKGFVTCSTEFTFPFQRGFFFEEEKMQLIQPEHYWTRSQDLMKAYHEAGTFWIGSKNAFLNEMPFVSEDSIPYFIEHWRVQDIDYPDDWERAELLFEVLKKRNIL